jgi:hypothetical protein
MIRTTDSFYLLTPEEALTRACQRDLWLLLKVPAGLSLIWSFFAPQTWKALVLLVATIVCGFLTPCPAGPELLESHLWITALSQMVMIAGVFWYMIYLAGYLSSPGWRSKAIAATMVLLFFPLMLVAALASGLIVSVLGVPLEAIWDLQDRWAPFESWRIRQ